ncbi:ead/Ea22-like family protein [Klebsiella pneumoniae]|uniref:ead/Ea22-like family protein n=1 Tax=Klebsiella pneumoniae TaxID=573 RepID=UPI000BBDAA78|nr:ead/Ea22-like family protein [Klebsiella pneumoniae]EIV2467854.1 hypothetical protein [Klebsiella pneumoniae]EIV5527946.1 hypothetical protein [Klebsiella pneumoniae]EIW1574763.1 hypothetical protein [Klebsiella pneumoniae]EIW8524168.1 hypothetical protein [Klebsiella pneumoniae]EIW8536609.1 hypothetical protein [Klebsiella pneumoniae]
MTDITELAQILKAAANITADAIDRLKAFPGDELIDLSQHEGEQVDIDIATLNQWYELSSPANVLALVEALEKAQQRIAELEEAEQKLCAANVTLDARAELAERRLAEMESRTVTAAAADVLAERQRQVTAEGWSPKHDDQYKNTELAFAASCYAFHAAAASWDLEDDGIPYDSHPVPKQWPWDPSWWKPTDARRDLVKAGALILAEIERIDRAAGIKVEAE